jgi:outer membrane protein, heavy metal efflux system
MQFLINLFVSLMGLALVFPNPPTLADEGKSPLYVKIDEAEATGEGEASLIDEVLKLGEVLAYAQEHNPAIRVAKSRLLAAQKVPAQASAYEDPMVTWESWNAPESFQLNEADNNIFRLSQKIPFPGKLRLKGEIASKETERMEADLGATEIDTVAQLKKAYYDLWLVYRVSRSTAEIRNW